MRTKTLKLNSDLLRDSGIPKAFWALGADTYWGYAAPLVQIHNYVGDAQKAVTNNVSVFFSGPRKSLKTFLATYALRCLMLKGYDCKYYSLDELVERYFAKEKDFHAPVKEAGFLCVDNIDVTDKGGSALVLDQIVRARKDEDKPIFLVSSLSREDISRMYQQEAISYIDDFCVTCYAGADQIKRDKFFRNRKKGFNAV